MKPGKPAIPSSNPSAPRKPRRFFTPAEDAAIKSSVASVSELARQFGRTRQAVCRRRKLLRERASHDQMTDKKQGLRAVACASFWWTDGMRYKAQRFDGSVYGSRLDWAPARGGKCTLSQILRLAWPDLDDAATRGCFAFALLPEAWGPDYSITVFDDGSVIIDGNSGWESRFSDVVAALEAAPKRDKL